MKGTFKKAFSSFEEGLSELASLSFSVAQSIEHGLESAGIEVLKRTIVDPEDGSTLEVPYFSTLEEGMVVAALAANTIYNRPTGNGVGWGACGIELDAEKCSYITTGGLSFGWETRPNYFYGSTEMRGNGEDYFGFWIKHPDGEDIPLGSSLQEAAIEMGWTEEK